MSRYAKIVTRRYIYPMNVTKVNKSRKEYICDKCGEVIPKGSSYIWWKIIMGRYIRWHEYHGRPTEKDFIEEEHEV